jgi:NADH-quinone oxidoreductase subunit C
MEDKLKEFFKKNFTSALLREDNFRDQLSFYIKKEFLYDILKALYEDSDLEFHFLSDICSLDWLNHDEEKEGRFEVIYNLYSLKHHYRFFVKVRLEADNPEIDSVTSIWDGADWMEREVYDLMGINFTGHPNLVKILTPDDLVGFPLRKDFPLTYEIPRFSYNKNEPPEVIT